MPAPRSNHPGAFRVSETKAKEKRDGRIKRPPLSVGCLLTATWLAGDKVGGAGEEVLLRGFVGRGRGEELEGLEVIRLHHGMVGGRATTSGKEEDREKQGQLGDDGRQVANDGVRREEVDELLTAMHQDDRQEDGESEKQPTHESVTLGSAAEDFGSRGRRGTGHGRSESEKMCPTGNPALGRVGTEKA